MHLQQMNALTQHILGASIEELRRSILWLSQVVSKGISINRHFHYLTVELDTTAEALTPPSQDTDISQYNPQLSQASLSHNSQIGAILSISALYIYKL